MKRAIIVGGASLVLVMTLMAASCDSVKQKAQRAKDLAYSTCGIVLDYGDLVAAFSVVTPVVGTATAAAKTACDQYRKFVESQPPALGLFQDGLTEGVVSEPPPVVIINGVEVQVER